MINVNRQSISHAYADGVKILRGYSDGVKFYHDSDLVAPVPVLHPGIQRVLYEVPSSRKFLGMHLFFGAINNSNPVYQGMKCSIVWRFRGEDSTILDANDNRYTESHSFPATHVDRQYKLSLPSLGTLGSNPILFRVTATNREGTTVRTVDPYAMEPDGTSSPVVALAKVAAYRWHQMPGVQAGTAYPYFEIRTNGKISRIRVNAAGQEGRFEDQTSHIREGLVTGSRSGIYNAGYILTCGFSVNFTFSNGNWYPQVRVRVELENSDVTLDETRRVVT